MTTIKITQDRRAANGAATFTARVMAEFRASLSKDWLQVFDTRQNWRIISLSFSIAILPPLDAYDRRPLKACCCSPCYQPKWESLHVLAVDSKLFFAFDPHERAIAEFFVISKAL